MYNKKTEWTNSVLQEEKTWIKQNQGNNGEIYLNNSNGAQDVNPYFACHAARGLLAGTVSANDLESVCRYLNWHTQKIIETGGCVPNYSMQNGSLESTGNYDSVDSYIAMFLLLLADYQASGGSPDDIADCENAVEICTLQLDKLRRDGMTCVSEENEVAYLMDNAEVREACQAMVEWLSAGELTPDNWESSAEFINFFEQLRDDIDHSIASKMWNDQEQRYEIGLDGQNRSLNFSGWNVFYPDALAQVYPAICDVTTDTDLSRKLYGQLCENFEWENNDIPDTDFEWPVLACLAARLEDVSRAETYMSNYQEMHREERSYPLHTGVSGDMAEACGELINLYSKKSRTSLFYDLYELVQKVLP